MKNRYLILDLETTSIHSFKRFCNPFDKRNKIVVLATLLQGQDPELLYAPKTGVKELTIPWEEFNFIVGHNIKFDLLFLWHDAGFQQWLKDGGKVWDTMTAEYLLTGQKHTYPSLDALTEQYGGELKDDRVTQMFKAGIGADEIDPDILLPYAEGDVINAETIFLAQTKIARRDGMLPILLTHMEHYLALCEMEFNGLYFNMDEAIRLKDKFTNRVAQLEKDIMSAVQGHWTVPAPFNPQADAHVSSLLFNSPITAIEDVELKDEDGEYKRYGPKAQRAGEIKTRKEKVVYVNQGFGLPLSCTRPTKKEGVYSNDKKVLQSILDEGDSQADEVVKILLEYRESNKFLNTYLYGQKQKNKTTVVETGLIPLVQPIDGCIHHSLDTVMTKTGRVNSKNPNGQNIPKELLDLVTSRYGDEGQMVAIDYSQLEVRVQAFVTQCPRMMQDVRQNIDFHALRLSYAVDKPYLEVVQLIQTSDEWKEKRKNAKIISFEKAYGAGTWKISQSTGLPIETVEKIFRREDERYPEVELFYKDVFKEIKDARIPTDRLLFIRDKKTGDTITRPGHNQGIGYYRGITGKKYHFYERAVLTKYGKVFTYFHPPDVYNFPVQGLAADIVSMQTGRLFRFLMNHRDKCVMVNEIHDEVLLDIKKEHIDLLLPQIQAILEDMEGGFEETFGMKFNVPILVDIEQGDSWGDCK